MPAHRRPFLFLSFLVLASMAGLSRADTLEFQDGHRVHGRLVSVSRGWVEFQPADGEDTADQIRVAVAEVRAIRFDDADDAGSPGVVREEPGGGDRVGPSDTGPGPRARARRASDQGRGTPSDVRPARDIRRRSRLITVSATERWTDTGIDVAAGQVISFSTAGTVTLGDDRSLGPEGDLDGAVGGARRPMPDRPAGALIGRIGMSPDDTFFIGDERLPFRVRTSGRLFLGVNDDSPDRDEGAFQVAVSR
jgi:hypothetical protein